MLRLTIATLFVFIPQFVQACSCVNLFSKCDQGWKSGDTIFLGKTIAMEETGPPGAFLSSRAAHFLVEESFRGADVAGNEIVVYTGGGGGDCGYPFVVGTSYLVYASRQTGDSLLHASICSETRPAVMVSGVLRELRAMRDRMRPDDVFGTIGIAPNGSGYEDLTNSQPLAGVTVRAVGSNGASFSTQTDTRGAYAFSMLPAGTYGITLELSPGFERSAPVTAEVSGGGGACRVDNFAKPDGRIAGTVVGKSGKTVVGFVTIEPADPAEAAAARKRGGLPGDDAGADGKFALPRLPPGRYRLVFHPKTDGRLNFRVTFYWPSNPDDAIDLAFGQHIDALQFTVPLER
jgi:hypothetical protein